MDKFGPMFKEYRLLSKNPKMCETQEYLYDLLKQEFPRGALNSDEVTHIREELGKSSKK